MIDYHTHFMRREHFGPDFVREWDVRGGTGAWPDVTAEEYDRAMAGVERVIVFGVAARALGIHTPLAHVAALVRRNPAKYIGFMALDPTKPDAIEEMERGRAEFGMRGIKLYPVMALFNPADSQLLPFFLRAAELGLPVMFHTGASPAARGLLKYSVPLLIDELAAAVPDLRIIMAHLAHPWQREAALVIRKHPHVWADISGVWHRPWQGYEAMIACLEWGVAHKLLFGSDYPLWTAAAGVEGMRRLNCQVEGTHLPRIPAEVLEEIFQRDVLAELNLA